ncbi:MAG: Uma2 family endonuclease [Methylocystis sp.]|uniref:Uma2 family endonuclease n=1 Tax=Methylocystis sp. TaxID=1911079 RepID=UPI003DA5EB23
MPDMTVRPKDRMTVEEYLVWCEAQRGRYELVDGVVYAQAAERAAHAKLKLAVAIALTKAVRAGGLPCHVLPDGMAVRVDARTVFEPDALVYCGPELPPDALLVDHPVVVVEVISPSTGRYDNTHKFIGYFALPSIRHYLAVDPDERVVVHHERREDGVIVSLILKDGSVTFDPPGLTLALSEIYAS